MVGRAEGPEKGGWIGRSPVKGGKVKGKKSGTLDLWAEDLRLFAGICGHLR
jgi:hypothetical protein